MEIFFATTATKFSRASQWGVFRWDVVVEDGFELRPFTGEFRELERAAIAEADEEDAFAVLRHEALRVYHAVVNMVFQVVGEGVPDDAEGAALVVALEVFDVFQHEGVGPVVVNQFGELEKEVALFLVREAVFPAATEVFGDVRDAEGPAGKTGARVTGPPHPRHCRRGPNHALP